MGLPFQISRTRVKDSAAYVVSQINNRRMLALNNNGAPRVKFKGVWPDFNRECSLASMNNPRAKSRCTSSPHQAIHSPLYIGQ
jgi:hypothetical protein